MKEIFEIIDRLQELSGNEQLDYLRSYKDNDLLKEVLYMTYNPDLKFKINEAKLDKALSKLISTSDIKESDITLIDKSIWESYKTDLLELDSKKGIKDADIERFVARYFLHREVKSKTFLRNVLLKDLRINMGVVSFNKVWEDFYFKYPYLGCRTYSKKNLEQLNFDITVAQKKCDGLFCNAIIDPINKKVEYKSRHGKDLFLYGSLEETLLKIKANEKFVLNGEILVIDTNTGKPLPRKISNGIARREKKTQAELDAITMVCWDIIPYKEFVKGVYEQPYSLRLNLLKQVVTATGSRVSVVDTWKVNSLEETMDLFNKMLEQGEEGLVVKELTGTWRDAKPRYQVKVKNESETDLRAYGFDEGSGIYAGMLGAIKCQSEDGLLKVDVGTGLTENDRREFWKNKDQYLGKILTVKYNAKINADNKDTWSLFLPVFVEWRDLDKDVADKLEDIE